MKKGVRGLMVCVLAFLCLFGMMQWTIRVKDDTVDEAYRTAQETLRATELTQSITRLEFGIRYGKNLENYYNMDSVLQAILRSSSYIQGVYVVSTENRLLYSAGEELPDPTQLRVLHNGQALYASEVRDGRAYMFMDITDVQGETAGTLMVMLNNDIMNRLITSYQSEGHMQSAVILGEMLLLFLIVYLRLSRSQKRKMTALLLAVLLAASVFSAQLIDFSIEAVKLSVKLKTITSQSVLKIAQVLQQQVDGVLDKGVTSDELYDVYGWLDDINDQLDSVESLDFTADGKVRATMDEQTLAQQILRSAMKMGLALLEMAAVCAALCVGVYIAQQTVEKRKQRAAVEGGRHVQA